MNLKLRMAMETILKTSFFFLLFLDLGKCASFITSVEKITAVTMENARVYVLVGGHDFCHIRNGG